MTVVEGPRSAGLIARVQAILLRPRAEWDVIDGEAATTQGLFAGYVCILAAISPVSSLIGGQIFGYGMLFIHIHPPLVTSIVEAIVMYVLAIVATFLLGLVIDALAPSFDGQKNQIQAMKVAAYSGTAGWVAGVFHFIPALNIIAFLGILYGFYLLYTGLPKLMKTPPEKAMGYTVVTIVCAIVIYIVVTVAVAAVAGPAMWGAALATADRGAGVVSVNGQSVDLGKVQAAATAAAASAKAMETGQNGGGAVAAIDPEKLKALLPDQVAGMPRTEVSAQSAGAAGVGASNAEAVYAKGDARVTVTVTDMTAMGAFAGMAGAMGVEASKETSTGYEKAGKVDGRFTTEEWDRSARSGKYAVLVANRFMVQAEGSAASIDDLKAAVAAVGPDRLDALAKG
jgi:hypothetical protein